MKIRITLEKEHRPTIDLDPEDLLDGNLGEIIDREYPDYKIANIEVIN